MTEPQMLIHAQCGRRHYPAADLIANCAAYRQAFSLGPHAKLIGRVHRRFDAARQPIDPGEPIETALASAAEIAKRQPAQAEKGKAMTAIPVERFGEWLTGFVASIDHFDATPVWKDWLEGFMQAVAEGFDSSTSPFGEGWAPLKRRRPKDHNQDSRPLIDTGALMASVTSRGPGTILEVSRDQLRFGTSISYAGFHQYGTSCIPARVFLGVNNEQESRAVSLLRQAIVKNLGTPVTA